LTATLSVLLVQAQENAAPGSDGTIYRGLVMKLFENIFRSVSHTRLVKEVAVKRLVLAFALMLPLSVVAQQTTLTDIKIRFREGKKREQVEKDAKLSLDDASRQLVVRSKHRPFDVNYDDIQKIIIEPDSYAGEIGFGAGMALLAVGPRLAPKTDKPHEGAQVVYVEYKERDGETASYVMSLGKNAAPEGVKRIKSVFAERVLLMHEIKDLLWAEWKPKE
jgi:hypothetical protein